MADEASTNGQMGRCEKPALATSRQAGCGVLPYLIGPALLAAMPVVYLIHPEFYLEHVLEADAREGQIVELITFSSALIGGIVLAIAARLLWRQQSAMAACVLGLVAAAAFFFAGEEASWGQHFFGWDTPDATRDYSRETNLHNSDLPVQSLGSLFLVVIFFVFPLAWWARHHLPFALPRGLDDVVPEGPVILAVACAFAWREIKQVYRRVEPEHEQSTFYMQFLEQVNEHKEMLVAVALLMFGVYRLLAVRRGQRAPAQAHSEAPPTA